MCVLEKTWELLHSTLLTVIPWYLAVIGIENQIYGFFFLIIRFQLSCGFGWIRTTTTTKNHHFNYKQFNHHRNDFKFSDTTTTKINYKSRIFFFFNVSLENPFWIIFTCRSRIFFWSYSLVFNDFQYLFFWCSGAMKWKRR